MNDGRPVYVDECRECRTPVYYARDGFWRKQTTSERSCHTAEGGYHKPTKNLDRPRVAVDRGVIRG